MTDRLFSEDSGHEQSDRGGGERSASTRSTPRR
jgi:hypothetical protein